MRITGDQVCCLKVTGIDAARLIVSYQGYIIKDQLLATRRSNLMQGKVLLVDGLRTDGTAHIAQMVFDKVIIHKFGLPTLCTTSHYLRSAAAFFIQDILQHIVFVYKVAHIIPYFRSIGSVIVYCFLQTVTRSIIDIGNITFTIDLQFCGFVQVIIGNGDAFILIDNKVTIIIISILYAQVCLVFKVRECSSSRYGNIVFYFDQLVTVGRIGILELIHIDRVGDIPPLVHGQDIAAVIISNCGGCIIFMTVGPESSSRKFTELSMAQTAQFIIGISIGIIGT
ncbi:hypothetical protein D9M68_536050 [compost metagenome]